MSLALYMDLHVHEAITQGLRRRGIDVLTAREDSHERQPDEVILERATALGRVLFTQDVDFIAIADQWTDEGRPFSGIAFAHQRSITVGQAVIHLEIVCQVLTPEEAENQFIRLPL